MLTLLGMAVVVDGVLDAQEPAGPRYGASAPASSAVEPSTALPEATLRITAGAPYQMPSPVASLPQLESPHVTPASRVASPQFSTYQAGPSSSSDAVSDANSEPTMQRGLRIPAELPGADAPPLRLPPYDPTSPQRRLSAIEQLFPNLPPLSPSMMPPPSPDGRRLGLIELENLALANSPLVQQGIADITAQRGEAIQAGTHPNPTIGYECDTVGSQRTANYQGGYFDQIFITAGKLRLAQAVQAMDIRNAELALRKTRIQVITDVQSRYYAVLVAEEAVRATHALAAFTDEIYRIQAEQLRGGEAAAYEPMQLRVMANQARGALLQARNRYYSAWKQLAAAVSIPDLPPTQLAGSLNVEVPQIRFDVALSRALEYHTDILTARNTEQQARINVQYNVRKPIPNFQLYSAVQKDFTGPPFGTVFNIQAGMPMPFYDRNVGGIMESRGQLIRAGQESTRARNEIITQAADAFERYENNRGLLEYYRNEMLPDQSRVYRGVYERHQQQPDRVSFGDVIVAQQQLATIITSYITVLGAQWIAVADLLNVFQIEDLPELQVLGTPSAGEPSGAPPPPDFAQVQGQ